MRISDWSSDGCSSDLAALFEHADSCQRFGQRFRLANKVPADNADRIRVERGLNPHHVLHDFSGHCQILASHEFHSREHGFPLSLSRLEYYGAVVAVARRLYERSEESRVGHECDTTVSIRWMCSL